MASYIPVYTLYAAVVDKTVCWKKKLKIDRRPKLTNDTANFIIFFFCLILSRCFSQNRMCMNIWKEMDKKKNEMITIKFPNISNN